MKKLFIYYSMYGSGDSVALYLQSKGIEVRKVEAKLKLSKNLFFAMMKGGFLAMVNKKAKLINYDNDISNYDEIIIGSPIWFDKLCPATNSILKHTDLSNKKISFVLYSGSGTCTNAPIKINRLYPDAKIVYLKEPKKYDKELKKLEVLLNE